jgi:uncharacterized protein YdhG (YjbR/CyaY superfamily)
MDKITYHTVDDYIQSLPKEEQVVLEHIRQIIKKVAPDAKEVISYQMPAYKLNGMLVYFAAFRNHYSLFIPPTGTYEKFKKELKPYKISKATWQMQKSQPIPFDLIRQIVKYAADINRSTSKK